MIFSNVEYDNDFEPSGRYVATFIVNGNVESLELSSRIVAEIIEAFNRASVTGADWPIYEESYR